MRWKEIVKEIRTDSKEYQKLDLADKWLGKYTYENLDKWPSRQILDTLVKRYPANEGSTIYRGLNFTSQEKYQDFIESIKDGILKNNGISSWSPSPDAAHQFSVTQPTYFLNAAVMTSYATQQNDRERLSGYRGIILELIVTKDSAIDVRKSHLGHEDEIILLPGNYHVKINKEIKQFKHEIEDGTDINKTILDLTKDDLNSDNDKKNFFEYILHHHAQELNDKAKKKLYLLSKPDIFWQHEVRDDADLVYFSSKQKSVSIYFAGRYFDMAMKNYFTPEDTKRARLDAKKCILAAIKLYDQYPEHNFEQRSISAMAKFGGVETEFLNALRKKVGKQYQDLEKAGREINNIQDPRERSRAIQNHSEKVQSVLKQVAN